MKFSKKILLATYVLLIFNFALLSSCTGQGTSSQDMSKVGLKEEYKKGPHSKPLHESQEKELPVNTAVKKGIRFSNKMTAQETGKVTRGMLDVYTLSAFKGKILSVKLTSPNNKAVFKLMDNKEKLPLIGATPADKTQKWESVIIKTGNYDIMVGALEGETEYTLDVAIKDPPKPTQDSLKKQLPKKIEEPILPRK